jgi:multisubunit Na+/H+ antiporter MnhC subunit
MRAHGVSFVTGAPGTFVARPVVADGDDKPVGRTPTRGVKLIVAILLALAVGFGVPLLWVWIGSRLQGAGSDSVSSSTAAVIFVGIILTYIAILFVVGLVQARGGAGQERPPTRYPWNRSMRDEPYRPGTKRLSPIEAAFVFTTIVISGAFLLWFFLLAGSPLPNQ